MLLLVMVKLIRYDNENRVDDNDAKDDDCDDHEEDGVMKKTVQ